MICFQQLPKILVMSLKRFGYSKEKGPYKIKKDIAYPHEFEFPKECLAEGCEQAKYELQCVILHHSESVEGGHYNAIVRNYSNQTKAWGWTMFDDTLVRGNLELSEVLQHRGHAYILAYVQLGANISFIPEAAPQPEVPQRPAARQEGVSYASAMKK